MKDEVMARNNAVAKACHEVHKALMDASSGIERHIRALYTSELPKSMIDRSIELGHRIVSIRTAWEHVFPDRHIGVIEGDDTGMVAMIQYHDHVARLFVKGILVRGEHTPEGVARLEKIRDDINKSEG